MLEPVSFWHKTFCWKTQCKQSSMWQVKTAGTQRTAQPARFPIVCIRCIVLSLAETQQQPPHYWLLSTICLPASLSHSVCLPLNLSLPAPSTFHIHPSIPPKQIKLHVSRVQKFMKHLATLVAEETRITKIIFIFLQWHGPRLGNSSRRRQLNRQFLVIFFCHRVWVLVHSRGRRVKPIVTATWSHTLAYTRR